jgi:thiamine pyrophosphate-dependent acetolactate synthase large subunit-like protein
MSNLPMYEMLAKAFAGEGVDTVFNLMGDGNMHWATAMSKIGGVQMIHARHEHCACAMAMGYHSATGNTGVASVTCGPGVTQISTALATPVLQSSHRSRPDRARHRGALCQGAQHGAHARPRAGGVLRRAL